MSQFPQINISMAEYLAQMKSKGRVTRSAVFKPPQDKPPEKKTKKPDPARNAVKKEESSQSVKSRLSHKSPKTASKIQKIRRDSVSKSLTLSARGSSKFSEREVSIASCNEMREEDEEHLSIKPKEPTPSRHSSFKSHFAHQEVKQEESKEEQEQEKEEEEKDPKPEPQISNKNQPKAPLVHLNPPFKTLEKINKSLKSDQGLPLTMLKERFVIYRDRSFKVAEITSYTPGKITVKNSHTFMKPTSILAPTCVLELAQMNECYLFAGLCARFIDCNGSAKLAPAILLKPIIECKQPKDTLEPPPKKIPQKLKKYEPPKQSPPSSAAQEEVQRVFILFPHQQAVYQDSPLNLHTIDLEDNAPLPADSALYGELAQTTKNKGMIQCLVDIDANLSKWQGSHEMVIVKPANANHLLQREVIVQVQKESKSAQKEGKRGILLNYDQATHSCYVRLYNLPFGFWIPLVAREAHSDFKIIANLRRGFASSAALRVQDIQMPLVNSDELFSYDQKEACEQRAKPRILTHLIIKEPNEEMQCDKCRGQQSERDEYIVCGHCQKAFHTECLKKPQLYALFSEWLCPQCVRCVNCLSMSTDADKMVTCASCNTSQHYQCMRLGSRAIIPTTLINDINQVRIKIELAGDATQVSVLGGNYAAADVEEEQEEELKIELEGESNMQSQVPVDVVGSQSPVSHHGFDMPKKQQLIWRCQNCVTCSYCSMSGPDSAQEAAESVSGPNATKLAKIINMEERKLVHPPTESELDPLTSIDTSHYCWGAGYQYCNRCRIKKENREYCPVCMKLWGSVQEPKQKNKRTSKRKSAPDLSQQDQAMIECQCGFWVHLKCDPHLTQKAMHLYQDGRQYSCPPCQRK